MHSITYAWPNLSEFMFVKGPQFALILKVKIDITQAVHDLSQNGICQARKRSRNQEDDFYPAE